MKTTERVIGLVGPSGVGKGFCKGVIRTYFPNIFSEPTIATTRLKRDDDGSDRIAGLSVREFFDKMASSHILFGHQPFGEGTEWYGFVSSSFSNTSSILTEVHIDNIEGFKSKFGNKLILIGLIAAEDYLRSNMQQRGDAIKEIERSLEMSGKEIETINGLYDQMIIDYLIQVNDGNRDQLSDLVVNIVVQYI